MQNDTATSVPSKAPSTSPWAGWWIPAALVVLSLVPAIGGGVRLAQLLGGGVVTVENARFFAAPTPVLIHIPAALVFSFLGALQLWPSFRRAYPRWHRVTGRVLLPAALLVPVSGLWMTLTYPWPTGDGVAVFVERLVFGVAMLSSVILGLRALVGRRFAEHGDWMIRAYAIGMGAGTQALTHLPWFLFVDLKPGETPRAVMMGLGWVINIVVAELVIRRSGTVSLPRRQKRVDPAPKLGVVHG